MSKFITLTDSGKRSERVNADRIIRYFPANGGTSIIYGNDHSEWYAETPDQVDALLGIGDRRSTGPASVVERAFRAMVASKRGLIEIKHNPQIKDRLRAEANMLEEAVNVVYAALGSGA